MQKRTYPSIELPRILNKDLIKTPTSNRIPEPVEPKKINLRKPKPKNEKPWYKRIFLLFFLMIIIPYTIFTVWATPSFSQTEQEKFWILVFVLISAIIWAIIDLMLNERKNKKLLRYQEVTSEYEKAINQYWIEREAYDYNEWLWRMEEAPEGKEALAEKFEFIKQRLEINPKISDSNYSNSELGIKYFLKKVEEYKSEIEKGFTENTYQYNDGYQFFRNNTGVFYSKKSLVDFENNEVYDIDLIYWVPEVNLFINIEIDEPYNLDSKYPCHSLVNTDVYGQKTKNLVSIDDTRDAFFKNNNWIVIRFAEEQIIKQPKMCYEAIVWVGSFFSSPLYNFKDFKYYLNWNMDIVNKWSKTQANDWAAIDYRKTYLKEHFKLS